VRLHHGRIKGDVFAARAQACVDNAKTGGTHGSGFKKVEPCFNVRQPVINTVQFATVMRYSLLDGRLSLFDPVGAKLQITHIIAQPVHFPAQMAQVLQYKAFGIFGHGRNLPQNQFRWKG